MQTPSLLAVCSLSCAAVMLTACQRGEPVALEPVPGPPVFDSSYSGPSASRGLPPVDDGSTGYAPSGDTSTSSPPPAMPDTVDTGPVGGSNTYVIQKGDSLWGIASRVYGNGQRWVDIRDANPGLNPQKMQVGQEIVLPD